MSPPCTPLTTAVHTECLQHSAARLLAVLGTATACIPLAEGSDSLVLVGLPEQIAKLLPAAANKAAEEGGLPAERAIMDVVDEFGSGTTCYIAEDLRAAIASTIAADRASRQVANNAEVEPVAFMYQDDQDLVEPGTGSCVVSKARCNFYRNETLLCAIPPATTGASTAPRPTDDELWDATLRDRDAYQEWADKLADAIAKHFGVDIGEHSNQNLPWAEALEAIENAEPVGASTVLTDERTAALIEARNAVGEFRKNLDSFSESKQDAALAALDGALHAIDSLIGEVAAQAGQVAVPHVDLSKLPLHYMEGIENGGYYLATDVIRLLAAPSPAKESK